MNTWMVTTVLIICGIVFILLLFDENFRKLKYITAYIAMTIILLVFLPWVSELDVFQEFARYNYDIAMNPQSP